MKNKEIPIQLLDFLKALCMEHNALIYGGASLIIRNILEGNNHYRQSIDIDIKKINTQDNVGPSSQFKPIDFKEEVEKAFNGSVEVKRVENKVASRNIEYVLSFNDKLTKEFGYHELRLELRHESNILDDSWETIEGFNLIKLSNIFADKIFATLENYFSGKLDEDNKVRHLVDLMLIPQIFNIGNIKTFEKEVTNYFSKKIDQEIIYANNKDDRKTELLNSLIDYWNELIDIYLMPNNELETVNKTFENNVLYNYDGDIFTNSRIDFVTKIIKNYERI